MVQLVRFAEFWMFGKLEGENNVPYFQNEEELASFS